MASDAISVDVSDFMANGANNRIVTATGTDAMNAESNLIFDGSALSLTGTLTVGVDDTGHDVKFFGATTGAYMLWDESGDDLIVKKGTISVQNAGGDTKFLANTNGNVTVTDLTVSGGDINYDNGQDATFSIDATTSTTAGRDLTISAGSTATGSANIDGGDLHLKSGGGDGTGTSIMTFSTKVSGTDTAAERMRIHTDGSIGIGTNGPSEKLEVYPDTNISAIFGRAHIGHMGHSDWAGFSHVDMNATGSYGLLQSSAGITLLNAADTKYIDFRLNNVSKMKLNSSGDFEVGNIITDNKIGTSTTQEYIDFSTSNEVNTFVNNTERLSITSSGVDITGDLTVSGSYNLASGDIPNNDADTTGNANTATALATARTIGGVSFDGSANIKLPGIVTYSRSVNKSLSRLDISTSFLEISSDLRIQMTLTESNVTFTLYLSRLRPNSKVLTFNIRDYNASGTPSLISNISPVFDVSAQEPVVIRFTLTGQTIGSTIYATPIIKANGSTAYLYRDKTYGFMEFTATEFSTASNNSSIGLLYAEDSGG